MREIPAEVKTLLKSRSMIGDNKPSYEVTVGGISGSLDILGSGEIPKKTYIGWKELIDGKLKEVSTSNFSMFVPTEDGRFMTCFYHDGKLKVGYTPDERFFYDDYCLDPEKFIEYASIINPNTDENIIPLNAGWNITHPIPIYKRPDGKVIILITNPLADESNIVGDSRIDCLISNSGNGDDFQYYSNVFRLTPIGITGLSGNAGEGSISAIKTPTGERLIAAMTTQFKNGNRFFKQVKIFTSDDYGQTWVQRLAIGTGGGFTLVQSIAQAAQIPSGEVYCSVTWSSTSSSFLISRDYGDTWTTIGGWEDDFGDEQLKSYLGSFYYDELTNTIYRHSSWIQSDGIYKIDNPTAAVVEDKTKWETVTPLNNPYHTNFVGYIGTHFRKQPSGNIALLNTESSDRAFIWGWKIWQINIPIKSININRNKNMAGSLNLSIDNKDGEWSPDNTVHQNVLFPNSEITVKQGYGAELVQTFKGLIDRIEMTTFPQELKLSIRDKLKLALDQTINPNVVTYTEQTIEAIFTDLASKAGLTVGIIETTGLMIAEKSFSWETYADCFSWLADLVGFEFGCDEEGKIYFKKDAIPQATDWILTFTDGVAQAYFPIVENSEVLKSSDGETTYVKDTDYTIDYDTGELTSITLPDGETLLSYVFAAYSFKEGEDIISLGYTIDDNDIYSKVIVYGKDSNDEVISAYKDYVSKDYYNVLSQKIMKIDVSEATTTEQLQAIADRAEMLMRSRVRTVRFVAIAVPWLQVGDLIQVVESSTTISELYRVTDLSTNMDDGGYTMQITCYHHSA